MPKNTDMTQRLIKGREKGRFIVDEDFSAQLVSFFLSIFVFPFLSILTSSFFGFFGSLYLQLFIIILLICCLPTVTTIITITRAAIAKGKSKKGAPESRQARLPTKSFIQQKLCQVNLNAPKKTCSNNSDWGKKQQQDKMLLSIFSKRQRL